MRIAGDPAAGCTTQAMRLTGACRYKIDSIYGPHPSCKVLVLLAIIRCAPLATEFLRMMQSFRRHFGEKFLIDKPDG